MLLGQAFAIAHGVRMTLHKDGSRGRLMLYLGAQLDVTIALPHLDAALASYSLVASWWQARKQIANWWLWIAVNLVYIGEYIYKDLWATALLYLVLAGLAILGWWDWRKAPATSGRVRNQP